MEQSEIEDIVAEAVDLIAITAEGLADSRDRSAKFLVVQAILTTYLRQVNEELAKLSALRDAIFADSIRKTEGKNITEKKINVAENEKYAESLKKCEELESLREWVKGHVKIFENAHILYRGLSRDSG
jgi:hypothetical protein